ncbi:unnamed protein product [Cuscuta europaea]|uniref:HMA domain-containing protein n=1 Tax=Cuscuta europaea TaxID=41803 RepID=A0A9P1EKR5_CUSEU|nr:unnamed protein product [Cuscuta europaea]
MKGINSVCSSQAATAICFSMEAYGTSIQLGGGRAIDRFNPIITDSRRRTEAVPADIHTSSRKDDKRGKKKKEEEQKKHCSKPVGGGSGGWSCAQPGDFVTPSSSRYLLNDEEKYSSEPFSSSSFHPPASASTNKVVVVLRVSLHCRGCEKKMRKHISKMQGMPQAQSPPVTGVVFQHRLCSEEGDSGGRCNAIRSSSKHIKGKDCTALGTPTLPNLACHRICILKTRPASLCHAMPCHASPGCILYIQS